MVRGGIIFPDCGSQLSCCSTQHGAGPVILGPVRVGTSSAQPSNFNMCGSYVHSHPMVTLTIPINSDRQPQQYHKLRYGPQQQLRLGHRHGSGGSTCHPDQYGPGSSMALRLQRGLRWLSRSQVSGQPWAVTGAYSTQTSTQILVAVKSWTQTLSTAGALAQMTTWPW